MKTFIEFCAGIGGFRVGLEADGWECLYSSEIDLDCEKTYSANFKDKFKAHDLTKVESSTIPDADLICAGFPCQPFSIAGRRGALMDPRSNVLVKILDVVRLKKTKFVLLENVANFATLHDGKYLKLILKSLADANYVCFYEILNAKDFGVAQNRRRVFILGIRKDLEVPLFSFTKESGIKKTLQDIMIKGDNSIPISSKWHKYIDLYQGLISSEEIGFDLPKTRKNLERIDANTDLNNCIFQIRSSGIRAISIENQYPTFAVSHSGGGAMIPVYSRERRHMSLLEMTKLMGFPTNFQFPVSRTHAIKQLSNAVCPPVIESIAKDISRIL